MSVLSDNWITKKSRKPTHMVVDRLGFELYTIGYPYSNVENGLIENWCSDNKRDIYGNKEYVRPLLEGELADWKPLIAPFFPDPVRYVDKVTGEPVGQDVFLEDNDDIKKVISFGVSSYGYDVRLKADQEHLKVFTNLFTEEIDPKRMVDKNFASPEIRLDVDGSKYILIPPHSYLQGPTMEYFCIPRDVLVVVLGKSTYARSGSICNVTPIEPEFEGEVVIEINNSTSSPVRCYLEEGIAQFVFLQGDEACRKSYKDKAGKYQGQTGLTYAKV